MSLITRYGKRGVGSKTVKNVLTDYCKDVCKKKRCSIQYECEQRAKNLVLIARQTINELQTTNVNTDIDKMDLSLKLLIQAGNGIGDILEFMVNHSLATTRMQEVPHRNNNNVCQTGRRVSYDVYSKVGKGGITAEKAAQSLLCAKGVKADAIRYWGFTPITVETYFNRYCNYHGISRQELINQCKNGRLLNL